MWRLMERKNEFNVIHKGNRLFQQWCVDQYAKILQWKLNWLALPKSQEKIRADSYKTLADSIFSPDVQVIGRRVILPSSQQYTPRWYSELYHDAMAIIAKFKKPDLFITFTCNGKWKEITRELLPGQTSLDRPDIVSRVFALKVKQLMKDIKEEQIFGKVLAYMYTIEFQKRGLPHIHLLLCLHETSAMKSADEFDKVVSAEIPNPHTQPILHALVMKFMIHRHQKQGCLKKGACKSGFPRELTNYTKSEEDGYPVYKRRGPKEGGYTGTIWTSKNQSKVINNAWVVPYNPYLLEKYQAHINVEVCSSIMAIKYVYKYIYKGHSKVMYGFSKTNVFQQNEIKRYFDGLYIGASEAVWKILGLGMHDRKPAVEKLPVHLPEEQQVYFEQQDAGNAEKMQEILQKANRTKLTAWMENNKKEKECPLTEKQLQKDIDGKLNPTGPEICYAHYPDHYRWIKSGKKWKRRVKDFNTIGRMWRVSPSQGELYYLRLLLLHAKGAENWNELLSYEGL